MGRPAPGVCQEDSPARASTETHIEWSIQLRPGSGVQFTAHKSAMVVSALCQSLGLAQEKGPEHRGPTPQISKLYFPERGTPERGQRVGGRSR